MSVRLTALLRPLLGPKEPTTGAAGAARMTETLTGCDALPTVPTTLVAVIDTA